MSETFRQHVPPHLRNIGEQQLDALLRIEELLTALATRAQAVTDSMGLGRPVVSGKDPVDVKEVAEKPKGGRGGPRRL